MDHMSYLRRGTHHNVVIQRTFDKYGKTDFVFQVLELVEPSKCIEREQFYIDTLKPPLNMRVEACGSPLGLKPSQETRDKMSEAGSEKWTLRSPDGEIHDVERLAVFCKVHGLRRSCLFNVANGRSRHHKGWTIKRYDGSADGLEYVKAKGDNKGKRFTLGSPNGETHNVENLAAFCRVHGLNRSSMGGVAAGRGKHHKGWTAKYCDGSADGLEYEAKKFTLRSPDGEIHDVERLAVFCRVHGLRQEKISIVASGRQRHHKGWTAKYYDGNADGLEYVRSRFARSV